MHGRSAIWFPLVLLTLLAALTFWIDRTVQPPQPKRDGSSRHDPDYTVNNFVANKFDSSGTPSDTLAAVSMVHFPDNDSTELVRPRYTQYAERKPAMQIQGQRGFVSSNGEDVHFMDNVKMVREASGNKGELTVLSEAIHIIPEQGIVQTDQLVSILQAPHTTATGTGMEFNNKLHTFKLFHQVHVHYERPGMLQGPTTLQRQKPAASSVAMAKKIKVTNKASSPDSVRKPAKQPVRKAATRSKSRIEQTNAAPVKSTTRIRRQYEANSH